MIYSVATPKGYAWFEAPGTFPATGQYRQPRGTPIHGMYVPEAFAVQLPAGARPVGSGTQARGIIATSGALGEWHETASKFGLQVGAGLFVAWIAKRWLRW